MLFISIDDGPSDWVCMMDNGTWCYKVPENLTEGEHTAEIGAILPNTDLSSDSCMCCTLTITFTASNAYLMPEVTYPEDGEYIDTTTPTVTGTGIPGSTIIVTAGGKDYTATVGADGNWSVPITDPLLEGDNTLSVVQKDKEGNQSTPLPIQVVVATLDEPLILQPHDGDTLTDPLPVISGTADPLAMVYVTIASVATRLKRTLPAPQIYETIADANGDWSVTPTEPLPAGLVSISASQEDAWGHISPISTITVAVVQPPQETLTIDAPQEGSTLTDGLVTFVGKGTPQRTITLSGLGTTQQTVVDAQGDWSIALSSPLADGSYTVTAVQTNESGDPGEQKTVHFVVENLPAAPVILSPVDNTLITDNTPIVSGTGTPGYDVQVHIGTHDYSAVVDAQGDWSVQVTSAIPDGTQVITATQTDLSGNESPAASITVTVENIVAPIFTYPTTGSTLYTDTPIVRGTGSHGYTVHLSAGGDSYTGTVDLTGKWEITVDTPMTGGQQTLSAYQVSPALHSGPSASVTVTVVPMAIPTITTPYNEETLYTKTPRIAGKAKTGSTLTLHIDAPMVTQISVGEDGDWSYTPPAPLALGAHTITAKQDDPLAGETEASIEVTISNLDAPVISTPTNGEEVDTEFPTFSGTGYPGLHIHLQVDGGEEYETISDDNGQWTTTLPDPLTNGSHTLAVTQVDRFDNVSAAATVTFTVNA